MDLKDKIVGLFLIGIVSLLTWTLVQTVSLKEEVFKLQQGQIILSKQIKETKNFVKRNLKDKKKKKKKKKKVENE